MAVLSVVRGSGIRLVRSASVQVLRAPVLIRTFASTRALGDEKSINVVSYTKSGQREQETLSVPTATEPVNPPGQDIEVAAQPLKAELLELLPPTMKKFTLCDQVAVITG
ncbi:unnamed protein product [Aureobasidium mustum]|uniref:Uncharacterized protein n=1 Tax=Aureobasidium mustum TaxID=2773714 RepID=A0A9N8K5V8_9PEZI|nr:unnamed protein product [Aureobasidium mustum]